MRKFKERAARLRRYPRGRGFGVQSPTDYNFITRVVKGRIDKDCCAATDVDNEDIRRDNYKFAHLCYRVAQYLKPHRCICLTQPGDNISHYIKAAVPEVEIEFRYNVSCDSRKCMVIMSPASSYVLSADVILEKAADNMWLIIEGIRTNDDTYRLWKEITSDVRSRITFDLYHYGVICFDRKRYKQNYKIYL